MKINPPVLKSSWSANHLFNTQEGFDMDYHDVKSLSHSKWRCKYHIVFAPKYRRQAIYGHLKADIGKILRSLCERKGSKHYSSRMLPGSYSYVSRDTAAYECSTIRRVSKREK